MCAFRSLGCWHSKPPVARWRLGAPERRGERRRSGESDRMARRIYPIRRVRPSRGRGSGSNGWSSRTASPYTLAARPQTSGRAALRTPPARHRRMQLPCSASVVACRCTPTSTSPRAAEMARGSIQPRHQKGCPAKGKDNRTCRCAPTVYAVLDGEWAKIGYLQRGWRKADLVPYDAQLAEMRTMREGGGAFKPRKRCARTSTATRGLAICIALADAGRISKLTYNTYEGSWTNHLYGRSSDGCCSERSTAPRSGATRRRSRPRRWRR